LAQSPSLIQSDAEIRANQVSDAVIAKGDPSWAPVFRVLDVAAGLDQGVCFNKHPRRQAWNADAGESVGVYLFYAPRSEFTASDRERITEELRRKYNPPDRLY
jgi:hypothetical protein